MRAKLRVSLAAVAVLAAAAGMSAGGSGAASAATAAPGDTWGMQAIPGLAALAWNGRGYNPSSVSDLGCSPSGNCVAVGNYGPADTPFTVPFVSTEVNGTWGTQRLAGLPAGAAGASAYLTEVSCGKPDFCTAVGTYGGTNAPLGVFTVTETGGTWGTPVVLDATGLGNVQWFGFSGLSCPAAGECTLIGSYTLPGAVPAPFTADESGGNWGALQPFSLAGLKPAAASDLGGGFTALSCGAPGNCTAGGTYSYANSQYGPVQEPFIMSESGHSWGTPQLIPGIASVSPAGPGNDGNQNEVTSVSCPDASDCALIGAFYPQFNSPGVLFTLDEAGGTWGQAKALSAPPSAAASAPGGFVSCRSAGDCVIAANVNTPANQSEAVTASEASSGAWGTATSIPGIAAGEGAVSDLMCMPAGDCTVFGTYYPGGNNPGEIYSATEPDGGAMGAIQPVEQLPGNGWSNFVVACPQDDQCTAAFNDQQSFGAVPQLATEGTPAGSGMSAPTVALTLSAPTLYAGQSAQLTATVSAAAGGTPLGSVGVTGWDNEPVCSITLTGGTGTCQVSSALFPLGTSTLRAAYSSDPTHLPATGAGTVTTAQAATVTRLAFTPGSISFAGTGTTLTVSGIVSSAEGTPSGIATVLVDGKAVSGCTNIGFTGTYSCKGTTGALAAGKHLVTLAYPGEYRYFNASTSASLPLTVSKRGTATTLALTRTSVTYRHESAEKFTASVSRAGSVYPTGKVAVRIGGTTICTITLSKGTGGCVLANTRLRAGTYTLAALYSGDGNYAPSWSARKNLKVAA